MSVWLYDIKNRKKTLLVPSNLDCDDLKKVIVGVDDLAFSLDDKKLYFQTTAWQLSDALHVVDLNGENLKYIQPSKDFFIIPKGEFAGDLAIDQLRPRIPFEQGGFNWYWAFTPEGKELGPIGPNLKPFGQKDRNADDF